MLILLMTMTCETDSLTADYHVKRVKRPHFPYGIALNNQSIMKPDSIFYKCNEMHDRLPLY